jgi:hypothetical protein
MGDDVDALVELPSWVKRVKPDAQPVRRKRTLSERLEQAAAERDDDVIDLVEVEHAIERLRTDA